MVLFTCRGQYNVRIMRNNKTTRVIHDNYNVLFNDYRINRFSEYYNKYVSDYQTRTVVENERYLHIVYFGYTLKFNTYTDYAH